MERLNSASELTALDKECKQVVDIGNITSSNVADPGDDYSANLSRLFLAVTYN